MQHKTFRAPHINTTQLRNAEGIRAGFVAVKCKPSITAAKMAVENTRIKQLLCEFGTMAAAVIAGLGRRDMHSALVCEALQTAAGAHHRHRVLGPRIELEDTLRSHSSLKGPNTVSRPRGRP